MTRITLADRRSGKLLHVTLRDEPDKPGETTAAWYGVSDELAFLGPQRFPKSMLRLVEDAPQIG